MPIADDQFSFDFEQTRVEMDPREPTRTHRAEGVFKTLSGDTVARFAVERHVERFDGAVVPYVFYRADIKGPHAWEAAAPDLRERIVGAFKRHLLLSANVPLWNPEITRGERFDGLAWVIQGRDGPLVYRDLDAAERMLWRTKAARLRDEGRRAQRLEEALRVAERRPAKQNSPADPTAALEAIVSADAAMQRAAVRRDLAEQIRAGKEFREAIKRARMLLRKIHRNTAGKKN